MSVLEMMCFAKWREKKPSKVAEYFDSLKCFPWSEVQSICQPFPHFPAPKSCHLLSNWRGKGGILNMSSRAMKIAVTVIFKDRIVNIVIKSSFLYPPVSNTGLARWGLLNKHPFNGHAQSISGLYGVYTPVSINCWHTLNAIELGLPWVGLCLSYKELCQDEIRFYKVLDGWGSHSSALIFQREIMFGLISRSCKICNIFFGQYFVRGYQTQWWEASEITLILTVVLGLNRIGNDSVVPTEIAVGRRSTFQT